jgi:myosin protein heavy chain
MRNQALEEQLELLRQHNGSLEAVSGQDVERLRQRVVQLEAELKSSNEVREDLMRRLGRESLLTARVAELELADNEQRAIIAETVQKLRSVTSENASLTCKLAQATFGSAEASKDRVAEVEALTLELTQSAELVMQLMENTRRELEESKGVVEKVSSQHSILQDRVIELQASCKEQSIAALASERLLDQVTREKNNLAQAIVKLEADVHARDERISELVQLCRDHSSSSSAFEEQLNSLSQDKRRLEIDLEEAREKVTRMVLERNDLNHLKQEAEAKRDELLSQVACIEDELKTQSEDLERLRKAELRSENTVCRNVELESSLRASEDDKRGLESQLHSMQARIEDLSTREKLIVAEKLRLQGQLDLVQQELESQSRHLSTEAFDECSQLRDRVAELEAQKDSQRMEKTYLAADLDRSRKEVERLSSALASTQAAYESKVAVAEARLAESQSALASFQAECDLVLPRVGAAVTSALHQVDQQATALENRVSQSANDLAVRISNLQRDLHFFRESTDFQVESLKEDGASVDRELSTLTVNSVQTQSRGSARCPLHVIAVEEILNSTLESRSDRTTDLELMEEARFDLSRIARENDGRLSNDASDVTGDIDQDNASSIEGISHLFASGHEGELSFSASDHQHAEADAVDAFPAPTTQEANVPSTHTASAERSASKIDMEALLVDRDYRSRQLKNLEIDKARLEGELNDKIDLLGRATSCLALVREERDSLQFKLNELAATAQVPRANLSTPKDKSQTHQQLYSPFLSPLFPKKGEQTSDTYHERIDSRTRVVDALSIEWGALRSQLERLRTENDELTKDLRSTSSLLKQRSEVFASELKRQQERCDALERELSDGKNALKIAQAKADLLESEHIRVEQQAESLQRALSESDEKRHAQTLALDRLLEETKLAAKMRFNLEERVQADSQQREQAASESERLRRDLEFVNEKHNDSLNRIDELQKRVDALSREKEDVSSELVAIVSRNEELERERERRVLEASSSQTELQQLYRDTLATLAQANERLDALSEVESNLASAESENLRLQRAIEDVQQELETSRRALQDLQVELAQARAESDASSSDQRRRLDEQQRGRQDAEKALETKVLELTEAHAAIQVAEACLLDSNNARCGLEQTVLKCRERIASLERDQQDTAGVLEAKVHELAETRDALRMSEASLANVERDRLALEQTVQGCNERIALLDVSNRELLEKVSVREGELKKATEDAFHAGGLASHAEGRWVELQSELGRVRTERDDFMAKCLVFEEQLKLEAQENWDLQSDLKRCRGELESVQCDLEQAVESRDDANSELTARTVEIEELREQIQELSDTVEANRQKFSDAERNRCRVQEELAAVQAKKVKLESKCQGLRHYVNKLMLKCEEWQEYCSDQSKELGKIRDENEYIKKSIRERDQVRRQNDPSRVPFPPKREPDPIFRPWLFPLLAGVERGARHLDDRAVESYPDSPHPRGRDGRRCSRADRLQSPRIVVRKWNR